MKYLKTILLGCLCLLSYINPALANDHLLIEQAWVREGPPRATVLAGYLHIKNISPQKYVLTKVSSPQFETTEMHESYEEDGMSRMRKHEEVAIPANGSFSFTPSGYHLMLMDPFQRVRAGTDVELILEFEGLEPMSIAAPVKRVID